MIDLDDDRLQQTTDLVLVVQQLLVVGEELTHEIDRCDVELEMVVHLLQVELNLDFVDGVVPNEERQELVTYIQQFHNERLRWIMVLREEHQHIRSHVLRLEERLMHLLVLFLLVEDCTSTALHVQVLQSNPLDFAVVEEVVRLKRLTEET
jgi:hypothetical protein